MAIIRGKHSTKGERCKGNAKMQEGVDILITSLYIAGQEDSDFKFIKTTWLSKTMKKNNG